MSGITWKTGLPPQIDKRLKEAVEKKAYDLANLVFKGVVSRTPVRTGQLRASWNVSPDSPNFNTVGPREKSTGSAAAPLSPPPPASFQRSRTATYHVSNGKTYAEQVEFGSPTNRPHLMLARTLASLGLRSQ